MQDYKYRGVIRNGKNIRGVMTAKDKHDVIERLKEAKIQPIVIKKKKIKKQAVPKNKINYEQLAKLAPSRDKAERIYKKNAQGGSKITKLLSADVSLSFGVKPKEILAFTNSLCVLKKAKFNNITALESVYNSVESNKLKDIVEDILIGVESGDSMHSVMSQYPKIFPPLYVNFVKVGEESGSLDVALEYARDYMESDMKLKKTLKGILVPKILQFVLITGGLMVALLFGAPMIEGVYEMFGSDKELPKLTKIAIAASKWMVKYWYIVMAAIVGIFALFKTYLATPIGKYQWDKFKIKFPVFGKLNLNITTNKFFKAMLLNLKNGLRIQDCLEISKNVTSNYYFLSLIETGRSNLLAGNSWVEPFAIEGAFSPMTLEMLEIGMKTDLVEMMEKIEEYVEQEINETIQATIKLLPDLMYVFIGLVLVFFVITVMVPLMDVYMGGFLFEGM